MSYRHFRNLRKSVGTLQYLMNNLSMVQDSHPCLSGLLAFKLNFFLSHDQIVNIINLSYQIRHYHTCILINFFFTEIGQQQNSICCLSSEEQSQSYRMRKHMEIRYMQNILFSLYYSKYLAGQKDFVDSFDHYCVVHIASFNS